jgi:hypothetical protein
MNKGSDNATWKQLGKRFDRFEPDRGSDKPSEWYILKYCILHPSILFQRATVPSTESNKETKEVPKAPESQNWQQWFQWFPRKPTSDSREGKERDCTVPGSKLPEQV